MEGEKLEVILQDCKKWIELGKFGGPFPPNITHFMGRRCHYLHMFCVDKPPLLVDREWKKMYRGVVNGSFFSSHFMYYTTNFFRNQEVIWCLAGCSFVWKAALLLNLNQIQ